MRYVQIQTEDGYKLVEKGSQDDTRQTHIFVQKDVEPFRSVCDGSIVTNRRELAEHNRRNDVQHESEFGSASDRARFQGRKSAERADLMNGTAVTHYGRQIQRERRATILESIRKHEAP
jgi:hypothetical protein